MLTCYDFTMAAGLRHLWSERAAWLKRWSQTAEAGGLLLHLQQPFEIAALQFGAERIA